MSHLFDAASTATTTRLERYKGRLRGHGEPMLLSPAAGRAGWTAFCGDFVATGDTPLDALKNLDAKVHAAR